MTPIQIVTLLVIQQEPNRPIRVTQAVETLHAAKLIEPADCAAFYDLTPRGKAMLAAFTHLPLPQPETVVETVVEPGWVIPGTDFEFLEADL